MLSPFNIFVLIAILILIDFNGTKFQIKKLLLFLRPSINNGMVKQELITL